jgi:hypothetical protein
MNTKLSPAKVTIGEVVFYYHNQPPITCLYVTETQRLGFVQDHRPGATYYTHIPYSGSGIPNIVNTKRKWYATDKANASYLHQELQGKYDQKEWCDIHDTSKLNIKEAT